MATAKSQVLGILKAGTLRAIADGEDIALPDRRAVAAMRRTLSRKRSLPLSKILEHLSRDELKAAGRLTRDPDWKPPPRTAGVERVVEKAVKGPRGGTETVRMRPIVPPKSGGNGGRKNG